MKKLLSILFVMCIFLTGCSNSNHPRLKKIDKVKFHYVSLSKKTGDYLKNKSEYAELLKQDKKMVVYAHCDYCPYIKRIQNAVDELRQRNEYRDYYNFYLQASPRYETFDSVDDMKAFKTFFEKCNTFCIYNPKINELFTAYGSRTQFALNLHYILDTMMYW